MLAQQPWFNPMQSALCAAVLHGVTQGNDVSAMLNTAIVGKVNAQELPLRFVPQSELPAGMAYEQFIFDTGCVPTRTVAGSNGAMHDACNALMWLHFPHTKAKLNALQAAAIGLDGIQGTRGRLRDALTLFDESALILCCAPDDAAPQQLALRQWKPLLVDRRGDWHTQLRPLVFGHAVIQKLQAPYPAITAQVRVLHTAATQLSAIDTALAASLDDTLTPQALLALPVLGIPQWWAANQAAEFYDNSHVFRPLAV